MTPNPTDHFAQLSHDLQQTLKRAEQKVLWEQEPAHFRCGDHDVDAYPIPRSGGRVVWQVKSREQDQIVAYGVF